MMILGVLKCWQSPLPIYGSISVNKGPRMKVAQLEQGVQSEVQLQFDCQLACLKAEIKLYINQNYVWQYQRDNTVNIENNNIRQTQLDSVSQIKFESLRNIY